MQPGTMLGSVERGKKIGKRLSEKKLEISTSWAVVWGEEKGGAVSPSPAQHLASFAFQCQCHANSEC